MQIDQHIKENKILQPNWEKAKIHGQASKVGFTQQSHNIRRCPCCFEQINKQPIPINQNTKQLQVLGFGFPLYFAFLRNCIFLLLVTIFSYNLIAIYRSYKLNQLHCQNLINSKSQHLLIKNNTNEELLKMSKFEDFNKQHHQIRHFDLLSQTFSRIKNYKKDKRCSSFFVGLSNVGRTIQIQEDIMRGGSILINIILLIYLRDKLNKLKEYFDERNTSPSDFSVMVTQMPKNERGMKQKLQNQIRNQYKINQIQDIILIPDMKQYEQMQQKNKHLIQQLKKTQQGSLQYHKKLDQIQKQQERMHNYLQQKKRQYNSDSISADKAIVILQTQPKAKQLIDRHNQNRQNYPNWQKVDMSTAPEPRQIIWENISLGSRRYKSYVLLGWLLSILLLIFLTLIFAIFSNYKSKLVQSLMEKYQHNQKLNGVYRTQAMFLVLGIIFIVVVFNKLIIATLFHKFTDLQRHSSTANFQFSFCLKYCLGLFFTTALMTLIVEAFMLHNYYQHDYGVIEQQSIMFIVNSFFVPLFWLVNPAYLWRRYKQYKYYGQKNFTQQEANHIMQMPQYDIGKRYGQILQIMWFTYLYLTLIPVGAFFSVIGLFIYYWVDKYNLLRRSTLHSQVPGQLVQLTLSMLEFTLVLRTLGQFVFDSQIRDGIPVFSYIFFIIALIYQFLPISYFISCFNQQKFDDQETPYHLAKQKFRQNYYDYHILFNKFDQHHRHDQVRMETPTTLNEQIVSPSFNIIEPNIKVNKIVNNNQNVPVYLRQSVSRPYQPHINRGMEFVRQQPVLPNLIYKSVSPTSGPGLRFNSVSPTSSNQGFQIVNRPNYIHNPNFTRL